VRVKLDPDGPEPLSQQLAALLRSEIETGKRRPGSRLPSINELAEQYGIATGTARKALNILKDAGLATGSVGHGTFVAR